MGFQVLDLCGRQYSLPTLWSFDYLSSMLIFEVSWEIHKIVIVPRWKRRMVKLVRFSYISCICVFCIVLDDEGYCTKENSCDQSTWGKAEQSEYCIYWLEGRCTRNPCKFSHKISQPDTQIKQQLQYKGSYNAPNVSRKSTWKHPNYDESKKRTSPSSGKQGSSTSSSSTISNDIEEKCFKLDDKIPRDGVVQETLLKVKKFEPANYIGQEISVNLCKEVTDKSVDGEKCKDLHSWFSGSGFTMLAKLEGHSKAVTGISLPYGCDKLYSGGKDKSLRAWDCNSGQCVGYMSLDGELGCIISEGPWVFVGLPNALKAWNLQNHTDFTLNGPVGQVNCMTSDDGVLYAGMEDGKVLIWKWNIETIIAEPFAVLKEHNNAVCSLVLGAGALYSASKDCTVKMWNRDSLQCMQTIYGHESEATSLLCWDRYLLTASLDCTIKAWGVNEVGTLDVVYERKDDCGVIAMCGMPSSDKKPILLCSYKDGSVRLYELPTFSERGRIFSKHEVQVIEAGVDGLFFSGDSSGEITVWKMI